MHSQQRNTTVPSTVHHHRATVNEQSQHSSRRSRHRAHGEAYPPHLLAQKLNNRGVVCIETGRYDCAIATLVRALKLSEQVANDEVCHCKFCSLESCMSISTTTPSRPLPPVAACPTSTKKSRIGISYGATSSRSNASTTTVSSSASCSEESESANTQWLAEQKQEKQRFLLNQDDSSTSSSGGYIYKQPIRVSTQSMHEGHSMGITLSLIVIFNLALAHHLSSLQQSSTGSPSSSTKGKRKLQKALQLYELAYQLQLEEDQDHQQRQQQLSDESTTTTSSSSSSSSSLRFTMIVANNLGEIHRVAENHSKHVMCLQHLLSTIMYLVDCRVVPATTSTNGSTSTTSPNTTQQQSPYYYSIELDGFFRNTSQLILQDKCASAA